MDAGKRRELKKGMSMTKMLMLGLCLFSNSVLSNENIQMLYCKGQAKSTLIGVGVLSEEQEKINITFNEKEEFIDFGFKPCLGELKNQQTRFTNNHISYECNSHQDTSLEGLVFYSAGLNINRLSGELSFLHTNRSKNGNIQTYYSMECEKVEKKF